MAFLVTQKPPEWGFQAGFVAPEWGWFHQAGLHSTWIAPGSDVKPSELGTVPTPTLLEFDGPNHSSISSIFGGRVLRFNDGASTNNTGITIYNLTGFLGGTAAFTVAVYCRWHGINADTANENNIYDEWGSSATRVLFRYDPSANQLEGFANLGGTKSVTGGSSTIENGDWERLCLTYDGANLQLWRNGVPTGSPAAASGSVASNNSKSSWFKQTASTDDGGAWDVAIATVQNRFWGAARIWQWSHDPFGPIRMADEVGVVIGLPVVSGRIMSSLAGSGGLAGHGGIAGVGGGLAA